VVSLGIRVAQKMGQKKALVLFTAMGIVFQLLMAWVLMQKGIQNVSFAPGRPNGITCAFVLVYILLNGCKSITNNMVVPMIADCSDYEQYRSGKFVPGLMGALFSFVDKVFAALGTAFVGLVMLIMGYNRRLPQIGDAVTVQLKWTTIFLYCAVPILGWICSLVSMKFYGLDKKRMHEITKELH
jgi:Na+/melibiose symporter-like transporter